MMVPSEWEQAAAVVDRLWDRWPSAVIESSRFRGEVKATVWQYTDGGRVAAGTGPTYVAALIDLGRKWPSEGVGLPKSHEGGA